MSSAVTLRDQPALRRVHLGTGVSITVVVSHSSVVSDFSKVIFFAIRAHNWAIWR
jgi:hypothetical protein